MSILGHDGKMADGTPDLNQISTAFTFVMILFSVFLIGFIFYSINAPLLKNVLVGTSISIG